MRPVASAAATTCEPTMTHHYAAKPIKLRGAKRRETCGTAGVRKEEESGERDIS